MTYHVFRLRYAKLRVPGYGKVKQKERVKKAIRCIKSFIELRPAYVWNVVKDKLKTPLI